MSEGALREPWVDTAKGGVIALVVFGHMLVRAVPTGPGARPLLVAGEVLATLRMPTFFLISGLFAARALALPVASFVRAKVGRFLWPYLLWGLPYAVLPPPPFRTSAEVMVQLRGFVTVDHGLWYLVALPVFFTVARLLRPVPLVLQLGAAAALSIAAACRVVHTGLWGPDHMMQFFPFFLAGLHFSTWLRAGVNRSGWWATAAWGAGWGAVTAAVMAAFGVSHPAVVLVAPLFAVPFALCLAANTCDGRAGRLFAALGRRTLPVYVLHAGLVALVAPLVPTASPGVWLLVAVPATAAIVAVSALVGPRLPRVAWDVQGTRVISGRTTTEPSRKSSRNPLGSVTSTS